jgi:hypothetical protein
MARISGVPKERASWLARVAYWMSERMMKKVPEPLAVAAHNGAIFKAYAGYEYFLAKASRVDVRLKALASIKAGALVGCPF